MDGGGDKNSSNGSGFINGDCGSEVEESDKKEGGAADNLWQIDFSARFPLDRNVTWHL